MAKKRERCPICGELPTDVVPAGAPACVIEGGDKCVRRGFERLERLVALKDAELARLRAELLARDAKIARAHQYLGGSVQVLRGALQVIDEAAELLAAPAEPEEVARG